MSQSNHSPASSSCVWIPRFTVRLRGQPIEKVPVSTVGQRKLWQKRRAADYAPRHYDEMLGRIKETDLSVAFRDNGYHGVTPALWSRFSI